MIVFELAMEPPIFMGKMLPMVKSKPVFMFNISKSYLDESNYLQV